MDGAGDMNISQSAPFSQFTFFLHQIVALLPCCAFDGIPSVFTHPSLLCFSSSIGAGMADTKEIRRDIEIEDLEATATQHSDNLHHLSEKVQHGDDALRVLHTHYEAFTPEEERKVLWKIDLRMVKTSNPSSVQWPLTPHTQCGLMLVINGLQFIDKNTITAAAVRIPERCKWVED